MGGEDGDGEEEQLVAEDVLRGLGKVYIWFGSRGPGGED